MTQEKKTIGDITSLFTYFDATRKKGADPEPGQIVFAPTLFTDRKPMIADASRSNPHTHAQANIVVRTVDDKVDFRGKPERLPIYSQSLAQTEELVMSRAKKRPCVILAKTDGVDHRKLPVGQQGKALNAFDAAYWLAPIYSVSSGKETRSFGPVMTARVKCMMYPEFMYVPPSGLTIKNPGVIRLDRMFWSFLLAASDPQDLFLSPDIIGICWSQIRLLVGDTPDPDYIALQELMLLDLPEECRPLATAVGD